MKRSKITRSILLLAAVSFALIYGCKKNNPVPAAASIVGTWGVNSSTVQLLVNGTSTYDTTYQYPAGVNVYTFMANGYYTYQASGTSITSGYVFTGSTLSLYDTSGHRDSWTIVQVINLNANSMTLQDTLFASHDSVALISEALTR